MRGRSECANCLATIKWFDLIPIISYFLLKRRCRNCKAKISLLYPIVETTIAIVLLLFFLFRPELNMLVLAHAAVIALLTLIFFLDARYLTIPDKILAMLAVLIVGLKMAEGKSGLANILIFPLGLSAFFGILFMVSKGRWIGFGDVKLIFLIGVLLGYPMGYLSIVASVWLATLFSLILIVAGKANGKTEIPFGSFLSAATIIFLIFENELQEISKYFF